LEEVTDADEAKTKTAITKPKTKQKTKPNSTMEVL
jgi:hypothetical protein